MTAIAQHWIEAINKEERLRLSWYVHNENKIRECADKKTTGVTEQQNADLIKYQTNMVENNERKPRPSNIDGPPSAEVEEEEKPREFNKGGDEYVDNSRIMRPVLLDVNNLIYKKGRVPYLKKRSDLLPENRYYFKETSGFEYGWQMWDCAKTMEMKRYGKAAIIKQTFYRRRAGIEQDPSWYRAPIRNSPTICNSLWD